MDLAHLREICVRYQAGCGRTCAALPGIHIYRRDAVSDVEAVVYEPVLCLVLQGAKWACVGEHGVELTPGDALLVSHDLPVVSRITRASVGAPYLALILALDMPSLRSLYGELPATPLPVSRTRPLAVEPADAAWVAPLTRYLALADSSLDAQVLGPSTLREVYYRLLLSPIGGELRDMLVADSHASRIARAIHRLRNEYRSPLSVPDLARTAGMGASAFHGRFRSVTGTTPLQYLKDLRLIEARRLLLDRGSRVSEAAYAVGYESPEHFSRDYRRKFGVAPSRDGARLTSA